MLYFLSPTIILLKLSGFYYFIIIYLLLLLLFIFFNLIIDALNTLLLIEIFLYKKKNNNIASLSGIDLRLTTHQAALTLLGHRLILCHKKYLISNKYDCTLCMCIYKQQFKIHLTRNLLIKMCDYIKIRGIFVH